MVRSARASVADIILTLDRLEQRLREVDFETFAQSWEFQFIAERGLEIISEASRRIPSEQQALHPHIPWRRVADLGNVTRHVYHGISPDLIWKILQDDLGPLRIAAEAIARRVDGDT